ncbi:MAG: 16S rRNA (cytosine(1402)-N(4))-methyltransferase RsmH [Acidimicrobiales bacterium]
MTAPRDLTPVHEPVMVDRVVDVFAAAPAGVHVDATLGDGGHAAAVLQANPALSLVGIDRDPDAIAASTDRLAPFGDRVSVRQARFDQLGEVVEGLGVTEVSGVLFDFGISSRQVNEAHRGFSYRSDGPLDMRMGQGDDPSDAAVTADDIVNTWPEEDLSRLLSRLGDEPRARAIARAIVAARPLHTTSALAEVISDAVPAAVRRKGHPARKTFQALRIEVNEELAQIPSALQQALDLLAEDGRAAAIAYHSGEDRIVKSTFREASTGGCTCPLGGPCVCGAVPRVVLLKRGAWKPGEDEISRNPRARSARLRAVRKLADPTATDPEVTP